MAKDSKPKPDAPYQSRPMEAYDGAALKPWGPMRGGVAGPAMAAPAAPGQWGFTGTGPMQGWDFNGDAQLAQEGAAKGYVDPAQADMMWAETTGGPSAGFAPPREKIAKGIKYSANVPVDDGDKPSGKTAPLFMTTAKPDEVERLVTLGVITRATADKIYSKRNEGDPMQKLRAKTAPSPGMDWAPSASSLPPDHFDAPLPAGKPLTSPALPAAPAPVQVTPPQPMAAGAAAQPEDDYAGAIAWSRKKWGL
jgi:hypothetical protein